MLILGPRNRLRRLSIETKANAVDFKFIILTEYLHTFDTRGNFILIRCRPATSLLWKLHQKPEAIRRRGITLQVFLFSSKRNVTVSVYTQLINPWVYCFANQKMYSRRISAKLKPTFEHLPGRDAQRRSRLGNGTRSTWACRSLWTRTQEPNQKS